MSLPDRTIVYVYEPQQLSYELAMSPHIARRMWQRRLHALICQASQNARSNSSYLLHEYYEGVESKSNVPAVSRQESRQIVKRAWCQMSQSSCVAVSLFPWNGHRIALQFLSIELQSPFGSCEDIWYMAVA
eukprot:6209344-Pleurochrysis_carterae.AAC.4